MSHEVEIRLIAPKTLEQKRQYLINQIADVDKRQKENKADLNAVSTNSTARQQIDNMGKYVSGMKDRISAYKNKRQTLVRQLTRLNLTIKNRNMALSGRK